MTGSTRHSEQEAFCAQLPVIVHSLSDTIEKIYVAKIMDANHLKHGSIAATSCWCYTAVKRRVGLGDEPGPIHSKAGGRQIEESAHHCCVIERLRLKAVAGRCLRQTGISTSLNG